MSDPKVHSCPECGEDCACWSGNDLHIENCAHYLTCDPIDDDDEYEDDDE